jgi:CelD/BcsL family acetyltransferase involved in cellulose biosynthesis
MPRADHDGVISQTEIHPLLRLKIHQRGEIVLVQIWEWMFRSIARSTGSSREMQHSRETFRGEPPLSAAGLLPARGSSVDDQPALSLELRSLDEMTPLIPAWRDLAGRTLESNIFLDPDFVLPALAYLHPRDLKMLLVFEASGANRTLVGLAPVALPAWPSGIARVYVHKQAALGHPLLDRARAAPALTSMLHGLRQIKIRPGALIFSEIPRDGPTFRLLANVFARNGGLKILHQYERAALFPATAPARANLKTKARKNDSRLLRRLAEQGALSYRICRGTDCTDAMTEFLALESGGWKGASQTALASHPQRAEFAKAAAEALARIDRFRVESLDLDGKAVAMGLIIEDKCGTYFWKTAYDEACAALSPGVLFIRELTSRLAASRSFAKVDSCATPDHPMIDRLWPERIAIVDLGVALQPGLPGRGALAAERLRRLGRNVAKRLLLRNSSGKAPIAETWRARS